MGQKNTKTVSKQITEKAVELLAKQTGMTEQTIYKWHKQFMSDFPEGSINKNQFIELYKQWYPEGKPEKMAKFAFKVFDTDKNGSISFQEFLLSTAFQMNSAAVSEEEQKQKRLEMAFQIFDVNGDEIITKKELRTLLIALSELESKKILDVEKLADEIFEKYDDDKNGVLTKNEFFKAAQQEAAFSFFH